MGAPLKRSNAKHHLDEHLLELERLADTAGAQVVGSLTQQLDRPNPATYLGKGKVDELRERIAAEDVTLVLFDDELSPTQGKNIEDATGCRVMDRAEVILDIFATRARSKEARMQVELAQLEYMLPAPDEDVVTPREDARRHRRCADLVKRSSKRTVDSSVIAFAC